VPLIAIVHPILKASGGQDYLALHLARALSARHNVSLLTAVSASREELGRMLIGGDLSFSILRVQLPWVVDFPRGRMERFKKLVGSRLLLSVARSVLQGYDLVVETQSNSLMPVDACYIHYPSVLPTRPREGPLMRAYSMAIRWLSKALGGSACAVIANSKWTAKIIEETLGVEPWVLHPPVDTGFFAKNGGGYEGRRGRIIATITRITPEKRVEEILRLASSMRDWSFVIAGFSNPRDPYLRMLQGIREKMRLSNVFFALNVPRTRLRKLLQSAKYYLHPPFREHFGISIVEAMASGTPPIVYRGGGSWTDVVSRLDARLGYRDLGEVPRILEKIEKDYERLQEKALMLSRKFDVKVFEKKALKLADHLLELRQSKQG